MSAFTLPADGPVIASEADATDFIGEAMFSGADLLVIPVSRLAPEFFRLSTGLAGAILQKCTNYHLRVAIVGDISAFTEKSPPLKDFVRESNRHGEVRFIATMAEL
ncbi:MAG: DUF4180 domain-containing protein [Microvirga sp.]